MGSYRKSESDLEFCYGLKHEEFYNAGLDQGQVRKLQRSAALTVKASKAKREWRRFDFDTRDRLDDVRTATPCECEKADLEAFAEAALKGIEAVDLYRFMVKRSVRIHTEAREAVREAAAVLHECIPGFPCLSESSQTELDREVRRLRYVENLKKKLLNRCEEVIKGFKISCKKEKDANNFNQKCHFKNYELAMKELKEFSQACKIIRYGNVE